MIITISVRDNRTAKGLHTEFYHADDITKEMYRFVKSRKSKIHYIDPVKFHYYRDDIEKFLEDYKYLDNQ